MTSFRDSWENYKKEILFALLLSAFTVLSHWLSRFIPVDLLENVLLLAIHSINTAICFFGAVLLFLHSDGLRVRKACAYALLLWGAIGSVLYDTDLYIGSAGTQFGK